MRKIKISDADKRSRALSEASYRRMQDVPVYSSTGAILGYVNASATSVGASKVAGGPVEYGHRFREWGWIRK